MTNIMTLKAMIDKYNTLSFTHDYIFGYADRGNIYASFNTADVLPYVCTLDKASRGAGCALRFKPNKEQKEILKTSGKTFVLCTVEYFDSLVKNSKYNNGEVFEKLVTEWAGQTWKKDNISFVQAGDIEIDGKAYQIKFNKATFTNEKSLARLTSK